MFTSTRLQLQKIFQSREDPSWHWYISPQGFYQLTTVPIPWFALAALICCSTGLFVGLFVATVDSFEGAAGRIAFIHVPASLASLIIYLIAAISAGIGAACKLRLGTMAALAMVPTGLMLAFLALWTGGLWSKSISGIWWTGNLHTYSELALVLLYLCFIGLHAAIGTTQIANSAGAWLLLAGGPWIPISIASAPSWSAGHQFGWYGVVGTAGAPSLAILASLVATSLGFLFYAGAAAWLRLHCIILEKERQSDWVVQCRGGLK